MEIGFLKNMFRRKSILELIQSHEALFGGKIDLLLIKNYIKAGADVNERNVAGGTVLFEAAMMPQNELTIELLQLLCKSGAQPNATNDLGRSALHVAAMNSRHEFIKILLQSGASPNIKDKNGKTPMDLANKEIFELIKEYSPESIETQRGGGEGDFEKFHHLLYASQGQCSVFVHNIKNNGYVHDGGDMLDKSHFFEIWKSGPNIIRVATDNNDRIYFLTFNNGYDGEQIYVKNGQDLKRIWA